CGLLLDAPYPAPHLTEEQGAEQGPAEPSDDVRQDGKNEAVETRDDGFRRALDAIEDRHDGPVREDLLPPFAWTGRFENGPRDVVSDTRTPVAAPGDLSIVSHDHSRGLRGALADEA